MERSAIREHHARAVKTPDFAVLHPGYELGAMGHPHVSKIVAGADG
jgi:hypothetical protein